jgi:hypothetical protein
VTAARTARPFWRAGPLAQSAGAYTRLVSACSLVG